MYLAGGAESALEPEIVIHIKDSAFITLNASKTNIKAICPRNRNEGKCHLEGSSREDNG